MHAKLLLLSLTLCGPVDHSLPDPSVHGTHQVRILEWAAMAPYSSTLAWEIPWVEEPGGLQSMGSRRVGHD